MLHASLVAPALTILVDGRSGSGKTTLAGHLGDLLSFPVVHLDDFYPGWEGLATGSRMVAEDVLAVGNPGFWRWDWGSGQRAAWVSVPSGNLIVEGVGSVTAASLRAAKRRGGVLSVRLNAEVSTRKQRALARDPFYAPCWDMWAAQEDQHFAPGGPGDVPVDLELEGQDLGELAARIVAAVAAVGC
ncbi:hypothetical protein [Corynebacterium caspium]|uniref:hypothetical protein n=1 Tax=Corynebacterium caspium TaxID=234828 RepID=UPI0024816720|nr:hypothetical protein [Corynebacterium caspium]WKD59523.1 hypothetical protein CCASP_05680 [Corynebacterium caspium DSM 44850]